MEIDGDKVKLLQRYNELLVKRNEVMNLTAHRSVDESTLHNVNDSLLFVDVLQPLFNGKVIKLLDIGSGGGCPAIPLKIVFPELSVTMLDSVNKKVGFLNETVQTLGLAGITALHARVEHLPGKGTYDFVTARAVAELPTLLEYALPFLKVGGLFFAFKGKGAKDEIDASAAALRRLHGKIVDTKTAALTPDIQRRLVIVQKIAPCPSMYPRGKNLPRLRPIRP